MSAPSLLESLASQIQFEMQQYLSNSVRTEGVVDGEELAINVTVDVDAVVDALADLLQNAFDKNKLSYKDSVDLAAICHHRILEVPIDEARAMAQETVGDG